MADSPFRLEDGFVDSEEIPLQLRRMMGPDDDSDLDRPPVLLVHGASAQHQTFCIPEGRSLADFLWEKGYEPWLLDWRGSCLVTDMLNPSLLEGVHAELDLDWAEKDLERALGRIVNVRSDGGPPPRIHVVAHCMGAGVVAQAIAKRTVRRDLLGHVVLLTLGLFYETPLDGKLKSQFGVLDRLWREGSVEFIDPRESANQDRWPPALNSIYEEIGSRWRPHPDGDCAPGSSHALCNRVSFMYGVPYRHSNLVKEIHGRASVGFAEGCVEPRPGERICAVPRDEEAADAKPLEERLDEHQGLGFLVKPSRDSGSWRRKNAKGTLELSGSVGEFPGGEFDLWADDRKIGRCSGQQGLDLSQVLIEQFGAIPLRMYLHGAQNVRRGWAGAFVDSSLGSGTKPMEDRSYIGTDALESFRALNRVTLITGVENQLWHRDSIDRMYEWLTSGAGEASHRVRRHVLLGYAHQDLLWGKKAWDEVFPLIVDEGLGGPGNSLLFEPEPTGDQ